MSEDTERGIKTSYVADPVQITEDLYVGVVANGGVQRSDMGADLLNDNNEVVAELGPNEIVDMIQELAKFAGN